MTFHSDSNLVAAVALIAIVGAFIVFFVQGSYCGVKKALLASSIFIGVYLTALVTVSLATPQKVVNVGESYCVDIWCIGIEKVTVTPQASQTVYRVDMRIFSDANRVMVSAGNAVPYLVDERGRRFPLLQDPSPAPFGATLTPGQSVRTSLIFATAPDARQLFLKADTGGGVPFWVRLYFGSDDSLLHKPTLLRVV